MRAIVGLWAKETRNVYVSWDGALDGGIRKTGVGEIYVMYRKAIDGSNGKKLWSHARGMSC